MSVPRLRIQEGERSSTFELEGAAPVRVGRDPECSIVLGDGKASREHCLVERDGEGFWLRDLDSRNGTRLNGRRVSGRTQLRAGDRIEIGRAGLVFEDDGPGAPSASELVRDPDTGLHTRAFLRAELGRRLAAGEAVSVAALEVDAFLLLESILGRGAADEALASVARLVEEAGAGARPVLVAGVGRGLLLALIAGGDGEAQAFAAAARAAVAEAARQGALPSAGLTLSGGLVGATRGAAPLPLLRAADEALAQARAAGGDRVVAAPPVGPLGTIPEARPARAAAGTLDGGSLPPALEPLLLGREGQRALALLARVLAADLDLDGLAELALGILAAETGAARGLLVLRDEAGELRVGAAVSPQGPGGVAAPASHHIVRAALERPGGVLIADAQEERELAGRESVAAAGTRSVVAAPILREGAALGAIYLEDNQHPGRFDAAALELVRAFALLVAGPLQRGLLHSRALQELTRARLALRGTLEEELRLFARHQAFVGRSPALKRLLRAIDRAADKPVPVVITGESGTGKELVARALHARSPRARGPFVAESCAALAEELLEAELFGCRKGAFTGADQDRVGLLEAAHEGTLFLDEVGEMSPRLQAKLLRFLQEGELRRVGDHEVRRVSARVVAASNRDLLTLVGKGEFREDLYYRLAVLRIEVPALRERREDIPLLVEHFAARAAREHGQTPLRLEPEALAVLASREWPGNIRQLENEVRKLAALGLPRVGPEHVSPEASGGPEAALALARASNVRAAVSAMLPSIAEVRSLEAVVGEVEREVLIQTLEATRGNRSETARRLGLSRPGLLYKLRRLGLDERAPPA